MLRKFKLLYQTVRHLKATQILHQLKYRIKKPENLSQYSKTYAPDSICFLSFKEEPPVYKAYLGEQDFIFLNQEHKFDSSVDWNAQVHGKLWNYNLQYANYLMQKDVSFEEKENLINSMYAWLNSGKLPLEPYPVSLRSINILRWFSHERKSVDSILVNVHAELDFLSQRPEYHLLGNHLLENAFSLLMGGAFFSNSAWVIQGQEILKKELDEQILADGAHYELSPMYHQIIFFRLLELIDWYSAWPSKDAVFEEYLNAKAVLMLSWLKNISFENGDIPHFNDSTEGISYSSKWLASYAGNLGIVPVLMPLGVSGYRSVKMSNYECKIDFAQLGPSYQPGHAHSDALSFICYYKNEPLFVEAGTSTYEMGTIRNQERSTKSHNTVVLNGENQSQVYGGFRVGNRATTAIVEDGPLKLSATHNGYYSSHKVTHKREFRFNETDIVILDTMMNAKSELFKAYFHLRPNCQYVISHQENRVQLDDGSFIEFENSVDIEAQSYNFALGFNKTIKATVLCVSFTESLKSILTLK